MSKKQDLLINTQCKNYKELSVQIILFLTTVFTVFITLGIVFILFKESFVFFKHVSIFKFLTGTSWNPNIKPVKFGVLPLVSGTLSFTFTTAIIALPIGLASAIFLSEYSNPKLRDILKPVLELLAGLPTVVYGYFALVYITPFLRGIFPSIQTFNVLSASIVTATMIIPTVASLSEDAIRAVPFSLRAASYALGSRKYESITKVVIPSALSGILSSFVLGISRVIGETIIVSLAAGNLSRMVQMYNLSDTLLKPIQTMTAAMVEIGISDVSGDSIAYKSLFAVGLTLFVITLTMNTISQHLKNKYGEIYS